MRISVGELTLEHLRWSPVWYWDDVSLTEPEDRIRPVKNIEECDASPLFIWSRFTTLDGREFEGDIAYDVDTGVVYAIEFWVVGEQFCFNTMLCGLAESELRRLRAAGVSPQSLFPLHFSVMTDRLKIREGNFTMPRGP